MKLADLSPINEFIPRHIGPNDTDIQAMLKTLGFSSLNELADKIIPSQIRTQHNFADVGPGISEYGLLNQLKSMVSKNKVFKSYIGMGYHDTITPTIIQRNIFENPVWYTAYTPYQAEIAQGRLEALLNFQTMVIDLTGMEISNSSLLDEGTAAAEAMFMAHALCKNKANAFVVSPKMHPHVIEVLGTRAEPLGFEMILMEPSAYDFSKPVFGAFFQYPDTEGGVQDHSATAKKFHDHGALVTASVDLLGMTLLTPPGEWGADIVVGNSQRFGVPLGFGGPHAAFLATKDAYKRMMPGRLVGISVDSQNKPALRLALQTREQHIRREKATSNICTAQVLLANMASMYAVYHGPEGLKRIAQRVNRLTAIMADGLSKLGYNVSKDSFFDTVTVTTDKAASIIADAEALQMNFRILAPNKLGISLNETVQPQDIETIWMAFNGGKKTDLTVDSIDDTLKFELPAALVRKSPYMTNPVFNSHHSETELLRYIHHLQNKDITLTHSMIPLGSCTMKLNATTELIPVSWPEISKLHPFAPVAQAQGLIEMIKDLEHKLCDITGFAAVSLQPNAGSQGEYAGLLVIRKYHQTRGEAHRNICLIPSSAHGTNPASAALAGMEVVVVNCDALGNVEVSDLKEKAEKHKANLACLMITYPSTHGVYEESIKEICQIIHDNGGQVYMDGANMNALVGMCRPGNFGADVSHMNLHKTFAIPHGGGGPGVGPIGVGAHLKEFLPKHSLVKEAGPANGISATTSAPWGSASILPISWAYITMMGAQGLQKATLVSLLSANYIAKKLEKDYPVLYKGKSGYVAHECIIDTRELKKTSGIDVTDIAKRLIDYGFHAPTMSFPVAGTLMIEPTESEPKQELDRFIDSMLSIRKEINAIESGKMDKENNALKNSPHTAQMLMKPEWNHPYSREEAVYPVEWLRTNKFWPVVGRVDNAYGDRNLICSCPSIEEYK
ncbi:aminomethyl-transferring glycine dehydrogenase [Bdellovibrio svalbardensis]|uniref:Glycine dehydrogenase (decarboxylating) n=1 Tax=Bdellovibrio svalbardensis TaxID=2972972 RepID=A0ABT6DM14_9BACT|nr:aminomethyl-transferring glycine dehydrogenase [Bdellovibrio svalbardensis]MDG0816856.1 aminomethyl-transferring glycine dehydrogenase [Bdellovibrio svalbardensis]